MNAILALKNDTIVTPAGISTNVYDQFVAIHYGLIERIRDGARIGDGGHGDAAFLAWHREYILRFEQALQRIDSSVFLPYWSWESTNSSDTDSIFVNDFMGPMGTITDGYLSESPSTLNPNGWRVNLDLEQVSIGTRLTRDPFNSSSLTRIADAGRNSLGKTSFTGRNGFRRSLERPHGLIHITIGGHMAAMTSPNDPIFFLHHANIDRLWAKWQINNPGDTNYPSSTTRYGHALDDLMWPWDGGESRIQGNTLRDRRRDKMLPYLPGVDRNDNRRPRDVLDIEALDYVYDDVRGS